MKRLFLLLLLGSMTSCTAQQVYEGAQSMERSRCAKEPANTYRECLERHDSSYRDYTQQRAENGEQQL